MSFKAAVEIIDPENIEATALKKLTRDLREAARTMTATEVRFLVDSYYEMQENRIRAANRLRAASVDREPHQTIVWLLDNTRVLETRVRTALQAYAENDFVGSWSMSIVGIGPVIAAGLLAHIDIEKAPHVGHLYGFAGLTTKAKESWTKGTKRPYNATLATLCWKIGESFVKQQNRENDFYGKYYVKFKTKEIEKNESGKNKEAAEKKLATTKIGKETEAYKAYITGKLPDAHVHARAKRKAVKLFLSHWFEVSFKARYPERECPRHYAFQELGHQEIISVPNDPF